MKKKHYVDTSRRKTNERVHKVAVKIKSIKNKATFRKDKRYTSRDTKTLQWNNIASIYSAKTDRSKKT
jgi:hypothetical protein